MQQSKPSFFILGLALFSMFFGSGNLIFPLFLGQLAEGQWFVAFIGFILTAVFLPFLGVIAMVMYEGHYRKFFDQLGRPLGLTLTAALLIVWIPLGSAPRCISLSFASLGTYIPSLTSPLFYGIVYSLLVAYIILQKSRLLNIMGAYLTPALLISLFATFAMGMGGTLSGNSGIETSPLIFRSLVEGYNTMDLIASFFFCATIIGLLKEQGGNMETNLKLVLKAGVVAIAVLGVVYAGLMYTAALHSSALVSIPKEQMLAHLAKITLGDNLGFIAAIAIFLACFTTSVALVVVFTEFLTDTVFKSQQYYNTSLVLTSVITLMMSLTGLEGITAVTSPVLQVCYPLLLLVILFGITRRSIAIWKAKQERGVIPSLSVD